MPSASAQSVRWGLPEQLGLLGRLGPFGRLSLLGLLSLLTFAGYWYWQHRLPAVVRIMPGQVRLPLAHARPDGTFEGATVDIAELAARKLGVRLQWVTAPDLDVALDQHLVDIVALAALSPERRRRAEVTDPWFEDSLVILSRAARPLKSMESLAGHRVVIREGTQSERILMEDSPQAIPVRAYAKDDLLAALCNGQADAVFVQSQFLPARLLDRDRTCVGEKLTSSPVPNTAVELATIGAPGQLATAEAFRDAIGDLMADGTLAATLARWSSSPRFDTQLRRELQRSQGRQTWLSIGLGVFTLLLAVLAAVLVGLRRARIEAQQAAEAKTRFLSNMSHEIRTPMNGVMGMVEMLLQSPLSAEQRSQLTVVRSSSESLLALLNDILDFSKLEAGKMTFERVAFDAAQLMEETASLLMPVAQAKGIQIQTDYPPELGCWWWGDSLRIRQVLANLAGNAVKFTSHGSVTIRARRGSSGLRVEVIDTGIGIEQRRMGKLFQSFAQAEDSTARRFGGSGLGLAISKSLVDGMGGQIGVVSVAGVGSTFWFELALTPAPAPAADDAAVAALPSLTGMQVLLAEDNEIGRRVAGSMLTRLGVAVTFAHNGQDAIDRVKAQAFDVILMDCQMPVVDGFEATRAIRKLENERRQTPVIALTANVSAEDRQQCFNATMDDYLSKPVRLRDLHEKLSQWQHAPATKEALASPPTPVA
ncbi:MAG: ATP-binding protein [Acidobacteria bacterium]|nr:ATP-binding protein [Acidobacteriota bacterium]